MVEKVNFISIVLYEKSQTEVNFTTLSSDVQEAREGQVSAPSFNKTLTKSFVVTLADTD